MTAEIVPVRGGTRDRALATALELFSRDGYDVVSMREIAAELGVTKAALYHHFSGKEEIARDLIGGYLTAVDELVEWSVSTRPELPALLDRWVDLVRSQGIAISKFIHTNQRLIRELGLEGRDTRRAIDRVSDTVVGTDSPPELRMQVRMALICLHTAAISGDGLGLSEDEMFSVARETATWILKAALEG